MPNQEKVPSPSLELKPFQRKMYAVYAPNGHVLWDSLGRTERDCIEAFEFTYSQRWSSYSRQAGYVVAEVIVSIVPVTSKSSTDG